MLMHSNVGVRVVRMDSGAKLSKKDRAREREEVERSWDVPGDVTANVVNAGSPHQAALGRLSPSTDQTTKSQCQCPILRRPMAARW